MLFYRAVSYILHPVLFSTIASFLFFIIVPKYIPDESERIVLSIVFLTTYVVPVILLFFLKRFKLINSYKLNSITERKFPVVFMTLLFFLLGRLLLESSIVDLLAYSFFGCALALILVYILFFFNIKTSLHTLSIAGLITFISIISYHYQLNLLVLLMSLFILFGIVSVARLKLKAHKSEEIYIGFLIGCMAQLASYTIYSIIEI